MNIYEIENAIAELRLQFTEDPVMKFAFRIIGGTTVEMRRDETGNIITVIDPTTQSKILANG